jgi:hypothetical protein
VGTGHGLSNTTAIATGTGAGTKTPAQTSALIHPYTGAGGKTEISFGFAAVFVGASLYLM